MKRFADQLRQLVQRQRAIDFPRPFVFFQQQRFFLIELVLNLADEFLQNVFKRDHPNRAAIFIDHDGEVQFALEKELQQFFQPRGLRHVNQLAARRPQIRAALRLEPRGIQIFDVNDPDCLVEVAALAHREARVAGLLRDIEAFGNRRFGVERDNFTARAHHLAHDAAPQIESVQHDVPAEMGSGGLLLRGHEQQAQFLLGMGAFGLKSGFDAELAEQPLRRTV